MIYTWPADLPKPTRSGYQAQNADPRRMRSTESGPPRYSRRYSSVARTVSLQMMLTRVQKQIFDQFHDVTLGFGTAHFWMPDPISDGWPLIAPDGEALQTPEGAPLIMSANWLCAMGDEPPLEGPLQGMTFPISFTVVVMP